MATLAPSASDRSRTAPLPGVAKTLVLAGMLEQPQAEAIHRRAQELQQSFVAGLLETGQLSASELAHTLSRAYSVPLIDLDAVDAARLPSDLLDATLAQKYQLLALGRRGRRLVIATANPGDHEVAEKIRFVAQGGVDWVVCEYDKLAHLRQSHGSLPGTAGTLADDAFDFGDDASADNERHDGDRHRLRAEVDDAPIVRFLHKMLLNAIRMGASDLHFEPYEHNYRVRFRIDGELREIMTPPVAIKERLASRIKVISRLDISEKRVPQDGRMKLKLGPEHVVDFRVSTLPTLFGEKIVIRILDSAAAKMGIDALGYEPEEKQRLLEAIHRPYGMILVTGPTGSGKTLSLYTCLNLLNQPGVNISTAEDPSEINMPGINQVNINDKAGLSFATALRAFLRQDPDIIMVGEIRDLETADIAIKAAQTGHLVLSTLHTNDAPRTLARLRNMGVAPFNIASSVILITAQRLARRLCNRCKQAADVPRETLRRAGFSDSELDGSWTPYKAVGCSACNNGYKGRVGIYEVMPISEALERIILADGTALDIEKQARADGVKSLRVSGLQKVKTGITSLEEVLSVTNE